MRIHTRLTIWNILFLFVTILTITIVTFAVVIPQVNNQSIELVEQTGEEIATELQAEVTKAKLLAKTIALSPGFLKADATTITNGSVIARLELTLQYNPEVHSAYITHMNGSHTRLILVFRESEGSSTYVINDEFSKELTQSEVLQFLSSYTDPLAKGDAVVTSAYFDTEFVEKPMVSVLSPMVIDGEYYGFAGVDVIMDPLFEIVNQVTDHLDDDSYAILLDGDQTILSHPSTEWDFANNWDAANTLKFKDWADVSGIDNIDQVVTASNTNEHIILQTAEVFVDMEHVPSTEWNLIIVTPTSVIESISTSYISTAILVGILAFIVSGGFTYYYNRYRIGAQITEIADIAKIMANRDLTVDASVESSLEELKDLTSSFATMKEVLTTAIENMTSTSIVLQSSSEELQSGTEEINASAEEVASTSQAMSNGATTQTELINEVSEEIKATTKLVDEIIASIRNNTNQVSQIALQTNILALNAGIEASRAGDYGRGFAVVAENIRKLSDQSKVASESITEVADEIAARLEDAFNKISSTMLNVVSVSEETAASAEEVAAAAEEMTATIEEIASAAQELTTQAEFSAEQVTQFKIKK